MKTLGRLSVIFLLGSSSLSLAWGDFGHMTVAAMAYKYLTPESKARVATLLQLNPSYSDWIADVPAESQNQVAFMKAATWPDFIKHTAGYKNDGELSVDSGAVMNIGYSAKLMHRYWHYIDIPLSPDNLINGELK